MDLEIRHLRMVTAIAEAGSISRAAAALGYTQPALTAQLQRIERALGGPLFERGRRGTRPTTLGSIVLNHSTGVLTLYDDLLRDVRQRGPGDTDLDTLRLGSIPGPLTALLMTAARTLFPRADTSLHVADTEEELLDLLAGGRLEFGLGLDYPGYELALPPELDDAVLAVEPIFVLLSAGHSLAGQPEVALADLATEQWLAGEGKDVRMRSLFRAACRRAGFTPRRVQRMNAAVIFPLIGQGHGVALTHALTPARPGVLIRPLAGDPMWARQRLIWPSHGPLAPHAHPLRDALTEAYWAEARRSPVYRDWLDRRTPMPGGPGVRGTAASPHPR
ncbi:LysR family transcriptional regulator [Micromonospora sp. NPDC047740]|uniref:LysR family transcriptional regulator n=1 Tax=Micromonospora sp. NPDC047740 TaxID=3364254 RepID=UPI0037191062